MTLLVVSRWVIRLSWIVFCAVWVASAFSGRANKRVQDRLSRLLQAPLYVLGTVLLFVSKLVPLGSLERRLLPRSDGLYVAAMVLAVIGIGIAVWARAMLGSNWSGRVAVKEGHELVETGPYRLMRHPIYTGLLVAFFGTALLRCSPRSFAGVAVFLTLFLWKIRIEERFLSEEFGDKYRAYQSRVKALIPFVL